MHVCYWELGAAGEGEGVSGTIAMYSHSELEAFAARSVCRPRTCVTVREARFLCGPSSAIFSRIPRSKYAPKLRVSDCRILALVYWEIQPRSCQLSDASHEIGPEVAYPSTNDAHLLVHRPLWSPVQASRISHRSGSDQYHRCYARPLPLPRTSVRHPTCLS